MQKKISYNFEVGGKQLEASFNYLAKQANGSVFVKMGETAVLATATMSENPKEDLGFFPLTVEYEENYWAAGKIKGSRFMKRQGRPTDEAVLSGRLIDRSIRPLFPKGMKNEVQVVVNVFSFDFINDPMPLAILATSLALETSNIPFDGPFSGIQIGCMEDKLIINPTIEEQEKGVLDLFVSSILDNITMIEAGAKEVEEKVVLDAIELAKQENNKIIKWINKVKQEIGKEKKAVQFFSCSKDLISEMEEKYKKDFQALFDQYISKKDYENKVSLLIKGIKEKEIKEGEDERNSFLSDALYSVHNANIKENVLQNKKRLGGRKIDEVREISIELSVPPRTHGSAIFNRGETQGISIATLGSPGSELILDGMTEEKEEKKRYMHFYTFPPFSTGECYPMRGPGRREIGHGALAEKALVPVIPNKEKFPYTIIAETEIMSSDGSTSMASVCGSTLALMDAGVPIKSPVAGIAMGLVVDENNWDKFEVLTDLCANEDFAGHMDFKVAGTEKGITAIQMDIKLKGLPFKIIQKAVADAKKGRAIIMEKMLAVIAKPKANLSVYAPRIEKMQINPEQIRIVIGPGGKMINEIIDKTGVQIDIEDSGLVYITSANEKGLNEAIDIIKLLTKVPAVGEVYKAKITKIMEFGAFAEFLPKHEGLIHISKLGQGKRVNRVSDVVAMGDFVKIKIEEIDNLGRYNLGFLGKVKLEE